MAFRANDSAELGRQGVIQRFVSKLSKETRQESLEGLNELIDEYGPVVEGYPLWHPFLWLGNHSSSVPSATAHGYEELDHCFYLNNAFVSCPYTSGTKLINSAMSRDAGPKACLSAKHLQFPLWNDAIKPVVVICEWSKPQRTHDATIPMGIAVARMLASELENWEEAEVGETWETMRGYFLGAPHGARSSQFVSESTGRAMKRVWEAVIEAGVFGPVMHE